LKAVCDTSTRLKVHFGHDTIAVYNGVMGSTGTGKWSVTTCILGFVRFYLIRRQVIRLLSGDTSVRVGDNLKSETGEIHVVRFVDLNSNRNIVIVNTPGFDNSCSEVTDTDILKMKITAFLLDQCVYPFRLFSLMNHLFMTSKS